MCGIAGFVKFGQNVSADPAIVRQMCDLIRHRGPDDQGIHTDGGVGLGMRRLSIVDLATGNQPISNEDGSVALVFNGEIYNHQVLRAELTSRGHVYRTQSDTESIVHAYEEYGHECVKHLRGMFAFALWDARKRCLFIARDRLGIKPLYYLITPELFLFGSEIKALLAYPGIRPEFNRSVLPEYLAFGYISSEETFYEDVRKLMPGHWLELRENGELKIEQYWDLPLPSEKAHDESYYVHSYRELLEAAVNSHLMSDVPLGVFLSGGVDSSAVAALMTKIRKEPIETFSVGYAEQTYSELAYARIVSEHLRSNHREVLVSEKDFFAALPKLIWYEDEPIVWPSSVALYFVARLARERVTVVLTGEGSDETLAGYTRYAFTLKNARLDQLYRGLLPRIIRQQVRSSIATSKFISAALRRKLEHTFLGKDGEDWTAFYFDNFFSAFNGADQTELLSEEVSPELKSHAAYHNVLKYWEQSADRPMLERLLYTDIKTYLVELLMKQDNMSMAASIESRVPFLDHVLVEFATRIPQEIQLKGLSGKTVLKRALEDLLPQEILYRPKLGFPTPWSGWLMARLDEIEQMLLEPRSLNRGFFKRRAMEKLFEEHRRNYRDHYDRIWRLLNLELWFRVCIEGERHEAWDSVEAASGLAVRA